VQEVFTEHTKEEKLDSKGKELAIELNRASENSR
jgi:hypothetical protein